MNFESPANRRWRVGSGLAHAGTRTRDREGVAVLEDDRGTSGDGHHNDRSANHCWHARNSNRHHSRGRSRSRNSRSNRSRMNKIAHPSSAMSSILAADSTSRALVPKGAVFNVARDAIATEGTARGVGAFTFRETLVFQRAIVNMTLHSELAHTARWLLLLLRRKCVCFGSSHACLRG